MKSIWRPALLVLSLALGAACTESTTAHPEMGDKPNGSSCAANSECVSGVCNRSVCQSNANGMGHANGAACSTNPDCGSLYCIMSVCESTPNGMGRGNGAPCTSNGECGSNVCVTGVCQGSTGSMGRTNGSPCAGESECGSMVCRAGACQGGTGTAGHPNGGNCTVNTDCASVNCAAGTCAPPTGGGRTNGMPCSAGTDCSSTYCVGGTCQSTADGTGNCNGSTCSVGTECASSYCVRGICEGTPDGTGHSNGMSCGTANDCASTFCVMGICASAPGGGPRPTGTVCTAAADCASNQCVDGVCCLHPTSMDGGADGGPDGDLDASTDTHTDARTDRPDRAEGGWPDGDDLNPDSSVPGEICRNGFDDNMNGQVDEGCECYVGQRQYCYTGTPAQAGIGPCAWGSQMCTGSGAPQTPGTWGPCTGSGAPATEACDGNDNNCDRQVDEGCSCSPGATRPCYAGPTGTLGVGVCSAGSQSCLPAGTWGMCTNQFLPVIERCDRIDNDCDGTVDEGCNCRPGEARSCYTGPSATSGVGTCHTGSQSCIAQPDGTSDWGVCNGEAGPDNGDACDGRDNNCDGQIDEGCVCTPGMTRSCFTGADALVGVGVCRAGVITCTSSGHWTACTGAVNPSPEACDGLDNDCDGEVDADWCICGMGMSATYHRRDFHMRGDRSMVTAGDGLPILVQQCGPTRCPTSQVAVEVSPDVFRCVPPPPACPPDRSAYYTQAGTWRCERGCEVVVTYGALYDGLIVCAPRPPLTCGPGQTPHYAFETEVWECRPTCDNGQYDIHMIGSTTICIPC